MQRASITVFDVADDRLLFLAYLAYLYELGVRDAPDAWLRDAGARLVGVRDPASGPPTYLEDAWTDDRRRLLVALTWPEALGARALTFPYEDPDLPMSGVYARSYPVVWGHVRDNLKWLVMLTERSGDWAPIASEWGLVGDVLRATAGLGLIRTQDGRGLTREAVDRLMADELHRSALATDGFVLSWWDIVAAAEGCGFSYEPIEPRLRADGGPAIVDGTFGWNRTELLQRIGRNLVLRSAREDLFRIAEAEAEAVRVPNLQPIALHRRITANGRVAPPAVGTKYRALFERLDSEKLVGFPGTITLEREELSELCGRDETGTSGRLRGPRTDPGLPAAAHTTKSWWYGPWNPDSAAAESHIGPEAEEGFANALRKKDHSRAWMAAGLRAKPEFKQRSLVAVRFEPVNDRRYWWPWREQLRAGTFSDRVHG